MPMHTQIAYGSAVILITVLIAAFGFWAMEIALNRAMPWLVRRPHAAKLMVVLLGTVMMVLAVFTLNVWVWATALLLIKVFVTLEESVYFSIVVFTTLGFGDVLLPKGWRILAGLAAANGLVNISLFTATLVEMLRRVRSAQSAGRGDEA